MPTIPKNPPSKTPREPDEVLSGSAETVSTAEAGIEVKGKMVVEREDKLAVRAHFAAGKPQVDLLEGPTLEYLDRKIEKTGPNKFTETDTIEVKVVVQVKRELATATELFFGSEIENGILKLVEAKLLGPKVETKK